MPKTRKTNLRISLVFGANGGVLTAMINVVKKGICCAMGSGKQQISWIHIDDFCSIVKWMIENKTATSAYNIIAPQPLTNKKLMSLSRKKLGINSHTLNQNGS